MASGSGPPDRTPNRPGIIRAGYIAWSIVGILVLAVFGVLLLYQVRAVFPPLVLALAIIFLLNPIVSRLQRLRINRVVSTIGIYLVVLTVIGLTIAAITPLLQRQFADLIDRLPDLQRSATRSGERLAAFFGVSLQESLDSTLERLREQLLSGVGRITSIATGAAHLVVILVLAPFIALYILIDLPRLQKSFVRHLPPHYRDEWLLLLRRCGEAVGGFFRGQLLVAMIVGTLSAIVLAIIRVPFWLPLGLLVGFFNLIPLIGPFVGGSVAVLVSAVDGGFTKALWTGVAMIGVQQLDNHFISPKVMGMTLRLHPVTIILALLAGGTIGGLFGMLLAVPGTAVGKILIMHYYATNVLGETPEGEQESDIVEDRSEFEERIERDRETLTPVRAGMEESPDGAAVNGRMRPTVGRLVHRASKWLQRRSGRQPS
jgi:predicted PurR-regulated permease PerM